MRARRTGAGFSERRRANATYCMSTTTPPRVGTRTAALPTQTPRFEWPDCRHTEGGGNSRMLHLQASTHGQASVRGPRARPVNPLRRNWPRGHLNALTPREYRSLAMAHQFLHAADLHVGTPLGSLQRCRHLAPEVLAALKIGRAHV